MENRYQLGYVNGHRKGMADCEPELGALRARVAELRSGLGDLFEVFDELVNRHYGGELPYDTSATEKLDRAYLALHKEEIEGGAKA